jgi:hypothetical protein
MMQRAHTLRAAHAVMGSRCDLRAAICALRSARCDLRCARFSTRNLRGSASILRHAQSRAAAICAARWRARENETSKNVVIAAQRVLTQDHRER